MADYRRVYDSRHLQADCREPGSAPETHRSAIEYGLPLYRSHTVLTNTGAHKYGFKVHLQRTQSSTAPLYPVLGL